MARKAAEAVQKWGLAGERGVAVVEGHASATSDALELIAGDVLPTSLLSPGSQRVVLLTDRHIYVLKLKRFGRPGEIVARYPVEPGVLSLSDAGLSFPDGETVHVAVLQAKILAHLAGFRDALNTKAAHEMTAALGLDEQAVTVEHGSRPKAPSASLGSKALDVTIGGGDLDFRSVAENVLVLVTDRSVRVHAGRLFAKPGDLIGRYDLASELTAEGSAVTFDDGLRVVFQFADEAQRIVAAAKQRD